MKVARELEEALVYPQKAYALARGTPNVADTLAWVLHMMGNDVEALRTIAPAVRAAPNAALLFLHVAFIDAALGETVPAAAALSRAVTLDPELEKQADVQALRAKVGRPAKP